MAMHILVQPRVVPWDQLASVPPAPPPLASSSSCSPMAPSCSLPASTECRTTGSDFPRVSCVGRPHSSLHTNGPQTLSRPGWTTCELTPFGRRPRRSTRPLPDPQCSTSHGSSTVCTPSSRLSHTRHPIMSSVLWASHDRRPRCGQARRTAPSANGPLTCPRPVGPSPILNISTRYDPAYATVDPHTC